MNGLFARLRLFKLSKSSSPAAADDPASDVAFRATSLLPIVSDFHSYNTSRDATLNSKDGSNLDALIVSLEEKKHDTIDDDSQGRIIPLSPSNKARELQRQRVDGREAILHATRKESEAARQFDARRNGIELLRKPTGSEEALEEDMLDEHYRTMELFADAAGIPERNFVLSWSPKKDSETPAFEDSSAVLPTLQLTSLVTSFYDSDPFAASSPGTFGITTPTIQTPFLSTDRLPFPQFHSTPKSRAGTAGTAGSRSVPEIATAEPGSPPVQTPASGVFSSMQSTFDRFRRHHQQKFHRSTPALGRSTEKGERTRFRSRIRLRAGTDASTKLPTRRQSAEWNARAAIEGVKAGSRDTQDVGWPADVSLEIVRQTLNRRQSAMATADHEPAGRRSEEGTKGKSAFAVKSRSRSHSAPSKNSDKKRGNNSHEALPLSTGALVAANWRPHHPPSSQHLPSKAVPALLTLATENLSRPDLSSIARGDRAERSAPLDNVAHPTLQPSKPEEEEFPAHSPVRMSGNGHADGMSRNLDVNELRDMLSGTEVAKERQEAGRAGYPITPVKPSSSGSTQHTTGSWSFLRAPSLSVIAPSPRTSPGNSKSESTAAIANGDEPNVPLDLSEKSKGKRKADDLTDERGKKGKKTTFVERPRRRSNSSTGISSYHSFQSRKRVRLSSPAPEHTSFASVHNASHLNTVSSRSSSTSNVASTNKRQSSGHAISSPRAPSRLSRISQAFSSSHASSTAAPRMSSRRTSVSQASIPISAIVSPRAPSIAPSRIYHMHDPEKPPPTRPVGWSLRFADSEYPGSPPHAWTFWFGFFLPCLWWIASVWRIPKTRVVGTDTEKAITVDDPQIEREARIWRTRCRIASVLFFLTYVPVIILLAIFTPRH